MNESITLKSGRQLLLGLAPFSVGTKLFKAVLAEVRSVEIDATKMDLNMELNLTKLDPKLIGTVKNLLCEIAGSDAVEAAVFECMSRCTLAGIKIDRTTFESAEAREDYLPVVVEVMKFNLAPFFRGLASSFITSAATSESAQK